MVGDKTGVRSDTTRRIDWNNAMGDKIFIKNTPKELCFKCCPGGTSTHVCSHEYMEIVTIYFMISALADSADSVLQNSCPTMHLADSCSTHSSSGRCADCQAKWRNSNSSKLHLLAI